MRFNRSQMNWMITISSLIVFLSVFSGCTTTQEENSDDTNNESYDLTGTWSMIDTIESTSFKIVYSFYDNSSFFTGVQNITTNQYELSLWGNYSVSNSRITMTVPNQNSTSSLKYEFGEDGNKILLYYEDETNFDILTRE